MIESSIAGKWVELGLYVATHMNVLCTKDESQSLEQISGTLKRGSKLIVTSF